MELVNVEYDLINKTNHKNNGNVGNAVIKIGNMVVHKEKLYIKNCIKNLIFSNFLSYNIMLR